MFQQAIRKFKLGALVLDDPNPTAELEEVQRLLAKQFPQVRHTHIYSSDGIVSEVNGAQVVTYEFIVPPVSVNG
jgi:hypothetical protein